MNRDDRATADAVRASLEADGLDALAVEVDVRDGVVELRGELPTHSERLAAAMIAAQHVPRSRIRNRLTVSPSGLHHRMADDEVAELVASALVRSGIDTTGLRFEVSQHVVVLSGTRLEDHTRARIRHVIASVPGVHVVRDLTGADVVRPG